MKGKLVIIKNILWAFGIVLCLAALLVGLGFGLFTKYQGSSIRDMVTLGEKADKPQKGEFDNVLPEGTLYTLGETADGGQAYIDSLTFLVDSSLIGLRDYGLLTGGNTTTQVWGSSAGNIPADTIADPIIRYPNDGSSIPVSQAAAAAKPSRLIISLGMDSLNAVDQNSFIANYVSLVQSIKAASPDTTVICCSLSSVSASYAGTDGLTVDASRTADLWIQEVCKATGAYYADVGSVVADSSGTLFSEYAAANGKTLNSAGVNKVLEYLRCHTA